MSANKALAILDSTERCMGQPHVIDESCVDILEDVNDLKFIRLRISSIANIIPGDKITFTITTFWHIKAYLPFGPTCNTPKLKLPFGGFVKWQVKWTMRLPPTRPVNRLNSYCG